MIRMVRSIISSVAEGVIKRFSGSGRPGETLANREYFQHYGFTSWPLPGGEMVLLVQDNRVVGVASDDRRYRVTLLEGEVALYTDEGDFVHLKRDRIIEVVGGAKVKVQSPVVDVVASTKVTIDSPETEVTGSLSVSGTASVSGALSSETSVSDPTGTMQAMRVTYNSHTHPGGGTPNPQM